MSEHLAKIELDVDGPRGPDVSHGIVVPPEWLQGGTRVEIDLPERLACSKCNGGGCDACGRSGAFSLPAAAEPLELTLPELDDSAPALRVRLPGLGASGSNEAEPRGQLLLSVRPGDQPSRGVRLVSRGPGKVADAQLVGRIVLMVISVSVLFLFLLWFSGWM